MHNGIKPVVRLKALTYLITLWFKVCPCKASEKRCSCRKWSSSRRIS
uniref:Monocyte differentiation antigen CD14, lps, IMMUNE SYSTEM n=1 Tax=Podoviridae sp. ct9R41 TaxID=2825227 RepID=A0A8S5P9N6_9CAUD|nr:MAG TPA: Monocyte differentiation antigen CD14, lps, IMMUNE SYSTEM [Podoviridae sp. ct9R41]